MADRKQIVWRLYKEGVYRFADDDRIVVLNEYAKYDEALAAARVPSSSAS